MTPNAEPEPASEPAAPVRVRVTSASHGHKVDAVIEMTAADAAEAERLGWGDSSAAAVGEAGRLTALHKADQGMEKRFKL